MSRFDAWLNSEGVLTPQLKNQILQELESVIPQLKDKMNNVVSLDDLKLEFNETKLEDGVATCTLQLKGVYTVQTYIDLRAAAKWFEFVRFYGEKGAEAKGLKPPEMNHKTLPSQCLYQVFSVNLSAYPACCAMIQANYFSYANILSQESVDALMNLVTKAYKDTFLFRPCRYIFNFVERRDHDRPPLALNEIGAARVSKLIAHIDPDEGGVMDFPKIYNWAKRQVGYQEMLCYNVNSGHVIHTAFVVPSNQE